MNRTLLVIIGLLAALLTAWGVMPYQEIQNTKLLKSLDPAREQTLRNTNEWKSFNESWLKWNACYNEILQGTGSKLLKDQYAELLEECLKKTNPLTPLKKRTLITDAELTQLLVYPRIGVKPVPSRRRIDRKRGYYRHGAYAKQIGSAWRMKVKRLHYRGQA
ncbi:MAG: hypothetical protein AB1599_10835 [Planctomycetota bacterium]